MDSIAIYDEFKKCTKQHMMTYTEELGYIWGVSLTPSGAAYVQLSS